MTIPLLLNDSSLSTRASHDLVDIRLVSSATVLLRVNRLKTLIFILFVRSMCYILGFVDRLVVLNVDRFR
jgi:hypothetical protein